MVSFPAEVRRARNVYLLIGSLLVLGGLAYGFYLAREYLGYTAYSWKSLAVSLVLAVGVDYIFAYSMTIRYIAKSRPEAINHRYGHLVALSLVTLVGGYLLGMYALYDYALHCGSPNLMVVIPCEELSFLVMSQVPLLSLVVASSLVATYYVFQLKPSRRTH